MALAIMITENDCAKHLTIQEVAELYREVHMIDEPCKVAKVACGDITGKRFVEIHFEREAHGLHDKELAELLGCDCAVIGQCGTEWYVCGFNKQTRKETGTMKVEMLQIEWGNEKVNNDYHVTLYKMSDGESEWYRINIENTRDGRYARREFTGEGARVMAQTEFEDIVYGDKTPLQYAWM